MRKSTDYSGVHAHRKNIQVRKGEVKSSIKNNEHY